MKAAAKLWNECSAAERDQYKMKYKQDLGKYKKVVKYHSNKRYGIAVFIQFKKDSLRNK